MASRGGAGRGQGPKHILSREQQMQVGAYAEKLASELHDWKPAPRFEEYVRQNAYMRNIGAGLSHEAGRTTSPGVACRPPFFHSSI